MDSCCMALRGALAETFMFYLEAHFFHWNVEGPTFSQLHELFGKIYADMDDAMDGLAEHIRTLGEYAPSTPGELMGGAKIAIAPAGDAESMVAKLVSDNELVLVALSEANAEAEESGHPEIANFLQERMDRHAKWGWFLRATLNPEKRGHASDALYDHPRSRN